MVYTSVSTGMSGHRLNSQLLSADSDLEDYKKNTPQSQMFLEIFVSVACNNVTKL